MPRAVVVAVLLLASCQFNEPADQADAAVDAPPLECEANTQVCVADRFTACGPDGRFVRHEVPNGGPAGEPITLVMDEYDCPLGCHATEPRCLDPAPSNGLSALTPPDDSFPDVALTDTTGATTLLLTHQPLTNDEVVLTESNGVAHRIPAAIIAQTDAPEILVLRVRSFSVPPGTRMTSGPGRAVAIVSKYDIRVDGKLAANYQGAAGAANCPAPTSTQATGGGGNRDPGGASSTGSAGGPALSTAVIAGPLKGGCLGGQIGVNGGGVPGGALQLVSGTRIVVASTGLISVAGGRGRGYLGPDDNRGRAHGGGSGGLLVVEAPVITVQAGGRINGRGGSGAAASSAVSGAVADGNNGDDDTAADTVPGATCAGCGTGGNGGTSAAAPGAGIGAPPAIAGGGGSVGRAIIRTRTGAFLPPPGSLQIASATTTLPTL